MFGISLRQAGMTNGAGVFDKATGRHDVKLQLGRWSRSTESGSGAVRPKHYADGDAERNRIFNSI